MTGMYLLTVLNILYSIIRVFITHQSWRSLMLLLTGERFGALTGRHLQLLWLASGGGGPVMSLPDGTGANWFPLLTSLRNGTASSKPLSRFMLGFDVRMCIHSRTSLLAWSLSWSRIWTESQSISWCTPYACSAMPETINIKERQDWWVMKILLI